MINHHDTCRADYPEKPAGEGPQHLSAIDLGNGKVELTCTDCGATDVVWLTSPDKVIQINSDRLRQRSDLGIQKYGTMLTRTDLNHDQWLNHFLEELLDAANYVTACRLHLQSQADLTDQAQRAVATMLRADSGEAWYQAEQYLKEHRPDLYEQIGQPAVVVNNVHPIRATEQP